MTKDLSFINGMIAVKEKSLLGERLHRMSESSAEEAFRQLTECGFGANAEAVSARDYELLAESEERATDEFIREYAPSKAVRDYLLLPRDYHNAKALVKAEYLKLDAEKMLSPEGTVPVKEIEAAVQSGDGSKLSLLGKTIGEASAFFREGEPTGVQIGVLFERALYQELSVSAKKNGAVARLLTAKADMQNLLTAFRSPNAEYAEKLYVTGGSLNAESLNHAFGEAEDAERYFHKTPYAGFCSECLAAKRDKKPFTRAERMFERYELYELSRRRFDLNACERFLYYVFRRRAECGDVRILFVLLFAGMDGGEIQKRFRSTREGL